MVRDRTSCLYDLITSRILDGLIGGNDFALIHALVLQGQVDVNRSSSFVDLSHSERGPHAVNTKPMRSSLVNEPLSNTVLNLTDLAPRTGQLERLTENVMLEGQIARISNQEGHEVSTHTILRPAGQTIE